MQFYVYTHARPDGSVFYVGKGSRRRAWDFSPSRRPVHHLNIVKKYGRDAISIQVIPCDSEEAAFALERQMIADLRAAEVALINRTDGGEGAAGRPINPKSAAAFAKSRGQGHFASLSPDAQERIIAGLQRGAGAWRTSPAGQEQIRTLGQYSARATALRAPAELICMHCLEIYFSKSRCSRYCSRRCGIGAWRARDQIANPKPKLPFGPRSEAGRKAIGDAQRARFAAMSPDQKAAHYARVAATKAAKKVANASAAEAQRALPDQVSSPA